LLFTEYLGQSMRVWIDVCYLIFLSRHYPPTVDSQIVWP
jgi:hypothetical protein